MSTNILAIETSCDETAVSVIQDGYKILSSEVASQIETHKLYGGVVPEIASRKHIDNIVPVYLEAMNKSGLTNDEIDGIAVTSGPGLIGSLLTGLSFAKALSFGFNIPLLAVNHIVSHLYAAFLDREEIEFPIIALIVSGGHTQLVYLEEHLDGIVLGKTRDDAAGEAFDKIARRLGLGYPGGPQIEKAAQAGKEGAFEFPVAFSDMDTLEFSYSGLKSAVINIIHNIEQKGEAVPINDIAYGFQKAVVAQLIRNTIYATTLYEVKNVVLAGGVAANKLLRESLKEALSEKGINLYYPEIKFCTDNAAMVGAAGYQYFKQNKFSSLSIDAYAHDNQEGIFTYE
ncbi:MAG: tRNA (adenosine(37)-N6)-threonylcarbamoyltransferase complex transferase subunit TsaD [Clostridia bacterium]